MDLRNNKTSSIFRTKIFRIISVMCVSLLTLSGCTRFDEEDNLLLSGGGRTHAKLSLDLMAPPANVVTRGVDMSDKAQVKIESLWIGIFDTKTGEQVGRLAGHVRKDDNNRITFGSGTHTLNDIDIYYYDSNPEVYIVGVANYHNDNRHVLAHKAGENDEFVELYKLLGIDDATVGNEISTFSRTITWEEFCNISIDTQSADLALDKDGYCPILMGFFNTSRGVITSTVNGNGEVSDGKIRLVGAENTSGTIELSGCINFKRLISEFQVSVRAKEADEYDRYKLKVSNVQYKVVNMPLEVYLAEHATFNRSAEAGKGTYLNNTPNSADVAVINKTGKGGYTESEWMDAEGSPDEGYTFSFQQYENKHWGTTYGYEQKEFKNPNWNDVFGIYDPDWNCNIHTEFTSKNYFSPSDPWTDYLTFWATQNGILESFFYSSSELPTYNPWFYASVVAERNAHSIREAKWEKSNILKSLVKDREHSADYNNYASYIVIKADIEEWDYNNVKSRATVQYTIHEGYTSNINGTAIERDYMKASDLKDVTNRILDFQCIRNTQYIYNIQINGAEDLYMQATSSGPYAHNDGLTGTYDEGRNIMELGSYGTEMTHDKDLPLSYSNALWHYKSSRTIPKFRIYQKKPLYGPDGNITGYTEENYGDATGDYAEWPPITGEMKSWDEMPDDLKDLMLIYVLDTQHEEYINWRGCPQYFRPEHGLVNHAMRLDEFFKWDPSTIDMSRAAFYFFVPAYKAPEGETIYSHFKDYMRGIYFVTDVVDEDGCTMSSFEGFEQHGLYDTRVSVSSGWVTHYYNHNISYETYMSGSSYRYCDQFFVNGEYYYWSTGLDVVSDDRIEWRQVSASYSTNPNRPNQTRPHPITKYTLKMFNDTRSYEVDIESKPEYQVSYNWYDEPTELISVPIKELIDAWGLSAGVYRVAVIPMVDEQYVQPYEPRDWEYYPVVVHAPKWTFDDELLYSGELHSGASDGPNETMTFGGLTMIGGENFKISENSSPLKSGYHLELGGQGRFKQKYYSQVDYRIVKFNLDQPAEVTVTVSNPGSYSRPLCFAGRNSVDTPSSASLYNEVSEIIPEYAISKSITFDTSEIMDDFDKEPFVDASGNMYMEFAIYSGDSNLYIEDIEIKPYTGKKESLSTSVFSYVRSPFYIDGKSYYLHNDNVYAAGRTQFWHFFVKGLTTYFAFSDSNPRASAYKLELYNETNDAKPVFSTTVSAEECKKDQLGERNFIMPVMIPSDLDISSGYYVVKLTAIGDGVNYISGRPSTLGYNGGNDQEKKLPVLELNEIADWLRSNEGDYQGWNRNPFWANVVDEPGRFFPNISGHYNEYKGLVLHGGTGEITLNESYIEFRGSGYPINNINTGRYMSFTTDRPIDVVIKATGGGDDRYFRLYSESKGLSENDYIVRKEFGTTTEEKTLSTGNVNGPTKFIICPEGRITLSSIQLKPAEDTRLPLVEDGSIAYSNSCSDPNTTRSHPYFYGQSRNPFYVMRYFTSYVSFSDALKRADSYLFEVYDDFGEVAFSATVDSSMQTYEDDSKKVFTVPMWTGNFEGVHSSTIGPDEANYSIKVTPIGNGELYKPALPQDIVKMAIIDWTDTSTLPPRDEYPDVPDYAWNPMTSWSVDILSEKSHDEYEETTLIGKDHFMEVNGLRINGSGNNGTSLLAVKNSTGEFGTDYLTWINFTGVGYPYIGRNDSNVGTGRNISITTNKTGKFIILARSGNSDTSRQLYLYNADKSVAKEGYIDSAQLLYDNTYSAAWMMAQGDPIVLDIKEDITEPTEFLICPEGSLQILFIMFVPKDHPLYDMDWSNGFPTEDTGSTRARSPQLSKWLTTFGSPMRQALVKK